MTSLWYLCECVCVPALLCHTRHESWKLQNRYRSYRRWLQLNYLFNALCLLALILFDFSLALCSLLYNSLHTACVAGVGCMRPFAEGLVRRERERESQLWLLCEGRHHLTGVWLVPRGQTVAALYSCTLDNTTCTMMHRPFHYGEITTSPVETPVVASA